MITYIFVIVKKYIGRLGITVKSGKFSSLKPFFHQNWQQPPKSLQITFDFLDNYLEKKIGLSPPKFVLNGFFIIKFSQQNCDAWFVDGG